jgi:hypothetical protein
VEIIEDDLAININDLRDNKVKELKRRKVSGNSNKKLDKEKAKRDKIVDLDEKRRRSSISYEIKNREYTYDHNGKILIMTSNKGDKLPMSSKIPFNVGENQTTQRMQDDGQMKKVNNGVPRFH